MKIKAELNYLRISPRKVRLAANIIRGKSVPEAERSLRFIGRRAAGPIRKLLSSAAANAKHNFQVTSPAALVVADLTVDAGPTLKRSRPRAFGRASAVKKRTSHVTLVLESRGREVLRPGQPKKSAIAVLRGEPKVSEKLEAGRAPEREAFREKARVSSRPAGFVRRMFRRKAI